MREFAIGAVWWLILTSPVVAYMVSELITHLRPHQDIGPHGGVMVEWDKSRDTVAEIVPDKRSGLVTVYVLDRRGKRPRPLPADSITLTLATPAPAVITLVSVPRGGNPPGWSAKFRSGRVLEPRTEASLAGTLSVRANGWRLDGNFAISEARR